METILIKADIRKKLFTANGELMLDVQLEVAAGELLSLFGPSGVGKTTILRILAGLTDADEGFIQVADKVWFDSSKGINMPARKRKVGYMFQDYALFPNMTIRENLKFAQPEPNKKRVDELLDLFDLVTLADRKPAMLSGGQQQRVALARAIAREPEILLLDEPLSAIDPSLRSKLQDEILEMHRRFGLTAILVSHDLPEVFKLSQRTIVLDAGQIAKEGNPFDVFGESKISGKVQFMAEVLHVEKEDIINIVTLLSGNSLVKVAVSDTENQNYKPGDKVVLISKAFNPLIQKI